MADFSFSPPPIPPQYVLSDQAPAPRTLIDILTATATAYPHAAAIDDGQVTTYAELLDEVTTTARWIRERGIGSGDRIGIRMTSGRRELYLAILSTMAAGAAYVPVDADDPDERATTVFSEANVAAVFTDAGLRMRRSDTTPQRSPLDPDYTVTLEDDAWIIFTSGSTGTPKGVAVTHRNAAAFVDAEARMFCQPDPLGPEDRVLAGLSVGFDASCEEMWLAWRYGACLVPAPRSLVRSGVDLGPWLISRDITVVSTVPTLAGMWPSEALDAVRLLIFGGEACPQELAARLVSPEREVWNTYGPTEATVVACAAPLTATAEVSIGLPLPGWDLAVVGPGGYPVGIGEVGELVIGGVGLARYLDAAKDAEKYAPSAQLGWDRAYRSGDMVRLEEDGLYFVGRVDDQIKIGGRRVELGEVDANLAALPGVTAAAVNPQTTAAGTKILVGYLVGDAIDLAASTDILTAQMPAALVPRLVVLEELPVRTSGKVDRKALPWPLDFGDVTGDLTGTAAWVASKWADTLGAQVTSEDDDFFSLGGTSLGAATLVGLLREKVPTVAVRDIYDHPRLGSFAEQLESIHGGPLSDETATDERATQARAAVTPVPRITGLIQTLLEVPLALLSAIPWLLWLAVANNLVATTGLGGEVLTDLARPVSWPLLIVLVLLLCTPLGRMPIAALSARLLLGGIADGSYPRGGAVHLRLWFATRLTEVLGGMSLAGATWVTTYARLLGAEIGKGVDLHSLPPVTGKLVLGAGAAVEPECDLQGYWVDHHHVHIGSIVVGEEATIGARSTLLNGVKIGAGAHIEPGSTVFGGKNVKAGSRWAGAPARKVGKSRSRFPAERPPRRSGWVAVYALSSFLLAALPHLAALPGLLLILWVTTLATSPAQAAGYALLMAAPAALIMFGCYALFTLIGVRLNSLGLEPGTFPVRSRRGWQVWSVERLMDQARGHLFPLYAAQLTPVWMRLLGAQVGKNVEISTVLAQPKFTEIRDGAFLADDTLVAAYELGHGWVRLDHTRIGKRSFLGNSAIAAPGRKLGRDSLVAVLSSTPKKAKGKTNWLGSPPQRLRRVTDTATDTAQTYQPTLGLKVARGVVETLRLLAPISSAMLLVAVVIAFQAAIIYLGYPLAWLSGAVILMAASLIAVTLTVLVKWACIGRINVGEHPLYSWTVWLNELQDTFVEVLAAPWFSRAAAGTPAMVTFLRLLGAKIGRGCWIESYWFPEVDLITLGEGVTVGRGSVIQTHLFHDRVLQLDEVRLEAGSAVGAHSVVLPKATLAVGASIAPGSLVMRGDHVPPATAWWGNPIAPRP